MVDLQPKAKANDFVYLWVLTLDSLGEGRKDLQSSRQSTHSLPSVFSNSLLLWPFSKPGFVDANNRFPMLQVATNKKAVPESQQISIHPQNNICDESRNSFAKINQLEMAPSSALSDKHLQVFHDSSWISLMRAKTRSSSGSHQKQWYGNECKKSSNLLLEQTSMVANHIRHGRWVLSPCHLTWRSVTILQTEPVE